jgi:putative endonuclease
VPEREYHFYVYILSSRSRTLYVGVTKDLRVRVLQHRTSGARSFTARNKIGRLVYFERFQYVRNAIAREKELDCTRKRVEGLEPCSQGGVDRKREPDMGGPGRGIVGFAEAGDSRFLRFAAE